MKYKTIGNCPYCDAEISGGIGTGWSGHPIMFEEYRRKHEENHPENKLTPNDQETR